MEVFETMVVPVIKLRPFSLDLLDRLAAIGAPPAMVEQFRQTKATRLRLDLEAVIRDWPRSRLLELKELVRRLNATGSRTPTGHEWREDNLRHHLRQHGLTLADVQENARAFGQG